MKSIDSMDKEIEDGKNSDAGLVDQLGEKFAAFTSQLTEIGELIAQIQTAEKTEDTGEQEEEEETKLDEEKEEGE